MTMLFAALHVSLVAQLDQSAYSLKRPLFDGNSGQEIGPHIRVPFVHGRLCVNFAGE
jgi:hypothetical protein